MAETVERERALADLVTAVGRVRSHLLDAWEATALIESLGYTDARIRREFGYPDTAALGVYVFAALSDQPDAGEEAPEDTYPHPLLSLLDAIGASLIYALPWLITFLIERVRPDALRLPGSAGPPLSLALMLSLIVSGGFIQAISRRGQFYIGLRQPGLAQMVCTYLLRLGAMVSVAAALVGLLVGWYFQLFSWPYLVLWADEFLVLCALWLTCGVLVVREEHWRVPLAFATGALTFVAVRAIGQDALVAQLAASGAVLAAAALQIPRVFARAGLDEQLHGAPPPRMTVLMYRSLPFFWYGTLYFCFLFADRFSASASVAALTGAPFGMRAEYKLGMDLALLTFLFASAGVEYGNLRFTRLLKQAMREPFDATSGAFAKRLRRVHFRAAAIVLIGFVPVSALVSAMARRLLPGQPQIVWTTLAIGDVGYLLLAFGLLNALALFSLNRPWSAVKAMTAALIVNLAVGFVLSHLYSTYFSAAGLIAGGFLFALQSSVVVRQVLRTGDHAISSAG
jgi:hypothetical protein